MPNQNFYPCRDLRRGSPSTGENGAGGIFQDGCSFSAKITRTFLERNLKELLAVMKEETIAHNLDDAKTPKENRAAYNDTGVKLQNKGKIVDAILLTCRCRQFSILKYSLILLGITYTIESIINKWKKLKQE